MKLQLKPSAFQIENPIKILKKSLRFMLLPAKFQMSSATGEISKRMTLWQCYDCLASAWRLPDDYVTTSWQLPDDCLKTAWRLPDDCLTTAWRLHNNDWRLPDNFLTTADNNCKIKARLMMTENSKVNDRQDNNKTYNNDYKTKIPG